MMGLAAGIALALCTGLPLLGVFFAFLIELAGRRTLPAVGALSVLVVFGCGGAYGVGGSLESVLSVGLAWFVVHQRCTARRPATDVLLVGLLLVVCATQTRSPWFALALCSWVGGLSTRLGSPGWIGLPVLVVAVPIFLVTPRFVPSDLREKDARGLTGFSADVELGKMQDLLDDPSRVFEATFDRPLESPPYFRGIALDRFDGRRWWTEAEHFREPAYDGTLADAVRMDVVLEAHPEAVLFVPGTADGIFADGLAVERDAGGSYYLPGPPRSISYTAWVRPPFGPGRADPFRDAEPRLDLPELSQQTRALIFGVVEAGGSPSERMDALSDWLRSNYTYTRKPRDLDVEAPLERFLLTTKEGHCEYFASALAVAGRVVGVPTRLINGFVGGDPISDRVVVVRRYHAHSWVEYFDGEQWVTSDPTPPLQAPNGPGFWRLTSETVGDWWRTVLGLDGEQQVRVARDVAVVLAPNASPLMGAFLGTGVIGGVGIVVLLFVRKVFVRVAVPVEESEVVDSVTALVLEAWDVLGDRGWHVPTHLPDVERSRWVLARDMELGSVLEELAWLSYEVRFGGREEQRFEARARELLEVVRNTA